MLQSTNDANANYENLYCAACSFINGHGYILLIYHPRTSCACTPCEMTVYPSFEAIHVVTKSHSKSIRLVNVYCPPSVPNVTFGLFLHDFEGMVNDYLFFPSEIVLVGIIIYIWII